MKILQIEILSDEQEARVQALLAAVPGVRVLPQAVRPIVPARSQVSGIRESLLKDHVSQAFSSVENPAEWQRQLRSEWD